MTRRLQHRSDRNRTLSRYYQNDTRQIFQNRLNQKINSKPILIIYSRPSVVKIEDYHNGKPAKNRHYHNGKPAKRILQIQKVHTDSVIRKNKELNVF